MTFILRGHIPWSSKMPTALLRICSERPATELTHFPLENLRDLERNLTMSHPGMRSPREPPKGRKGQARLKMEKRSASALTLFLAAPKVRSQAWSQEDSALRMGESIYTFAHITTSPLKKSVKRTMSDPPVINNLAMQNLSNISYKKHSRF